MNLSDILFARVLCGASGGSTVDDGYCIEWDGNTEGREMIMVLGAVPVYKVSNVVLNVEKLTNAHMWTIPSGSSNLIDYGIVSADKVVGGEGWCSIYADSTIYVISGVAGTHNFMGYDVTIPSNGTYFLSYEYGDTRRIAKPAAT